VKSTCWRFGYQYFISYQIPVYSVVKSVFGQYGYQYLISCVITRKIEVYTYIHTYIHTIGNYLYLFCVLNGAIKLSVFVCPTFAIYGVANCWYALYSSYTKSSSCDISTLKKPSNGESRSLTANTNSVIDITVIKHMATSKLYDCALISKIPRNEKPLSVSSRTHL